MTPQEAFIKATKVRAKAYFYIFDEFRKELGEQKAKEIFSRAIYRLGEDNSSKYSEAAKQSPKELGKEFCADAVGREVFNKKVIGANDKHVQLEMKSCPLVQTWQEMGLSKQEIKTMCDIAYNVDFGTMESLGYKLSFPSRLACEQDSCILEIVTI